MAEKYNNNSESYNQKYANNRDNAIVQFLNETGCTISELCNVKVEDIIEGVAIINNRKVEISKKLIEEISKVETNSKYVFSSRQSKKITPRRVQQLLKNIGESASKIRHKTIKRRSKNVELKKLKQEVGNKILLKKISLQKKQIIQIREQISDKIHLLIFDILQKTGCKISELVELKKSDIQKDYIKFGKRQVKVEKELCDRIIKNSSEEFVFSTRQSAKISDKRVFQILKLYSKKTGIEVNQRILRNSKIKQLIDDKKAISEIQEAMGIKKIDFARYGLL